MSEQLTQIDSLLVNDQVDSAMICLKNLPLEMIQTKADSAYYYILMAESRYRDLTCLIVPPIIVSIIIKTLLIMKN